MTKFKSRGVKGDSIDAALLSLGRMILPISNHRVSDGGELHPDLVLQPGHECHPDQGSAAHTALHRVSEFSASCPRILRHAHFLEHPFPAKIVHKGTFLRAEMSANNREVLPHGRVSKELADESVTIALRLGKEQDARGKSVDPMHNERTLSLPPECSGHQGQRRHGVGSFDRYGWHSGRFIDRDDRFIFVEDLKVRTFAGAPLHSGTA